MTASPSRPEDTARRVLDVEIAGLARLSRDLPADFAPFVEAVLSCQGRLVVSGVGKSAHIGRKIAATLASTGTPSFFVHATEASHGDLGMIMPGDLCLVISNSGHTAELKDLIGYCQRFEIPVAAVTSNPESVLARAGSYLLQIPNAEEACAIGMAPTTSTTMTLALGDALAVSLMEARGFTPERFRNFHPGGKLGLQLATVAELMHGAADLPLVAADTPMPEVLLVMTSRGFGTALVVENGRLSGLISDGDLRRHMDNLLSQSARDIATPDPTVMRAEDFAAEALATMNRLKINVLPVVDAAQAPVGILHMHDLLRAGVK